MKLTKEKLRRMIKEQLQVAIGPQIQPMRAGDRLVLDINEYRSIKNTNRPAVQVARMRPNNHESLAVIRGIVEQMGIEEFLKEVGRHGQMKTPRYKLRAWVASDKVKFQEYESAEFEFTIDR